MCKLVTRYMLMIVGTLAAAHDRRVQDRYYWCTMIFQSNIQFGKPAADFTEARRSFRKCSAGVVAVVTAMVLPLLLGFTSLGVEVGHWYLAQRQMQGAADAAAISA